MEISIASTPPGNSARKDTLVRNLAVLSVTLLIVLGLALAAYGWLHGFRFQPAGPETNVTAQQPAPMQAAISGLPDFTPIIQEYGPAVVNIQVITQGRRHIGLGESGDDPMFQFFRRFGVPLPSQPTPRQGAGSGFIISPDGIILTNAHVVDGASEVTVKLTDRRELKARVVGLDKPTDVAVLRVDARDLPVARLGASEPLRVGEWVLAIGAPFGFENSATAGIVSAKARALPDEAYVPFIQTDVAVNPGNSGGPLFNLRGEVVGINSQIYSQTGGYQGLSFAIPIDVALKVKDQILHDGKVTRGRLGVGIQDVNQALAQSFGLKKPAGALVSMVENGSPAERAGMKAGDVILALNGTAIQSAQELPPVVAALQPGAKAVLEIWRNGSMHKLTVQVGELTQELAVDDAPAEGGRLGLAARPLNADERQQLGVAGGLLVLEATGPALRAGIREGDVILALNGNPLRSVEELRNLADKAGKRFALLIQRGEAKLFVPMTPG
ncbi:MAG TPA: DegQ family serine endoprotease [Thiobacillaceae bacterium]|nr:DegQ family serine endoprotease [Thiobacillaceae bacterium]HNU64710.1 DegQ family serine endoprotease [Thiobacillaceae bacterium]